MKKNLVFGISLFAFVLISIIIIKNTIKIEQNDITGMIIAKKGNQITIQDKENIIYTFEDCDIDANVGNTIILNYTGVLNKNTEIQQNKINNYELTTSVVEMNENDLFGEFYQEAKNKLQNLSLDEKIGQLFLVRYSNDNAKDALSKYKVSGFVFYEKDFKDKTTNEVINMINDLQNNTNIPLLTAVDEEGGKIIRISSNSNLVSTPFKSSSTLYNEGGIPLIKQDTIAKSAILKSLGLNLNLAPVVDVSTNQNAYMYERTLKRDTSITSDYAAAVIEASKNTGVSYTLKHFPGYGNNTDTHVAQAIDTRTYNDILTDDLPPFRAGIQAGAEAVLISHNIITNIDANNPSSLSTSVHNLLRNELQFKGIVITDDLDMGATSSINDRSVKALLAGNDLIITTNYQESIGEIKNALNNNTISEATIDNATTKVLAWKYYKGLIIDKEK